MRTRFSDAARFRRGQHVTVSGMTGIAVGWRPGRIGKLVLVEITAKRPDMKGRVLGVPATAVRARRGRPGSGPLPRLA